MKVRDAIKMVEKDGWFFHRQTGSHRHFRHATKKGLVTIPGKAGDDVPRGTLNAILKQAGLK